MCLTFSTCHDYQSPSMAPRPMRPPMAQCSFPTALQGTSSTSQTTWWMRARIGSKLQHSIVSGFRLRVVVIAEKFLPQNQQWLRSRHGIQLFLSLFQQYVDNHPLQIPSLHTAKWKVHTIASLAVLKGSLNCIYTCTSQCMCSSAISPTNFATSGLQEARC